MKTGFAKVDITPPLGCVLNGYYRERYADGVIAPLYVTAVAYSDGEQTALTLSLDISEILQKDTDIIRKLVSEHTGIPYAAVFVACIHTHTAPVISEIRSFFKADPDYIKVFHERICEAASLAIDDLKESVFSIAFGKAEGISFVRRFRMKDGSTMTNPKPELREQIAEPVGAPDETVALLRIKRSGAPDIAVVQFQTHPDVIGGNKICPDWPGFMRDNVEAALKNEADGNGVRVIFFNGAQGDVNHVDRMNLYPGDNIPKGVEHSMYMGRVLADAVLAIYGKTEPVSSEGVSFRQEYAAVAVAKGTDEEVAIAKQINEKFLAREDISSAPFDIVRARRYLRLEKVSPTVDLNIVCITVGDIAFVGLPGEPFTEIGRRIRSQSPYRFTLTCCNANGSEGYFVTDDALLEGGYETNSSLFLPGVADALVNKAIEMLAKMKAE